MSQNKIPDYQTNNSALSSSQTLNNSAKQNTYQDKHNIQDTHEISIKCTGNRQCIYICVNSQCQQDKAFLCGTKDCKCQQQHGLCLSGKIFSILKVIKSKIFKTKQIKQFIDKTIDTIIDQFSQLRQILLIQIQQKMKYTQLFQIQRTFLSIFQEGQKQKQNEQKIKSKDAAVLWEIVNKKLEAKNNVFDQTTKILQNYQKETKSTSDKVKDDIENLILKQQMPVIGRDLNNNQKNILNQLVTKSSICKTNELSQRLIKFFPRRIQKMQLLYKASSHNFNLVKYYQLCGSAKNTVVLFATNKDKIGGGYTPFSFISQSGNDQWVPDPQRQSFLFSLSNNDKFWLNTKNNAIYRSGSKSYIYFGNTEILIRDNAHTNTDCRFNCNTYYMNQKYTNGDKQSYLRLNGNQVYQCTMKQWQVWRVEF